MNHTQKLVQTPEVQIYIDPGTSDIDYCSQTLEISMPAIVFVSVRSHLAIFVQDHFSVDNMKHFAKMIQEREKIDIFCHCIE